MYNLEQIATEKDDLRAAMKNIIKQDNTNKKKDIWIWIIPGIGVLVRLWLTESQPLFAIGNAMHDDRLFLTLAKNILDGNWLGPFDSLTLIKGPFFSIWVALAHILGIPLLLSGHILYAASCLLFAHAVKPLLSNKFSFVFLYLILLFNPAGFDAALTRATRDMIYPSLSVAVVACAFGVLLSSIYNNRTWLWATGLGVAFSCLWLTREEGMWVFPFLLFIFFAGMILIGARNCSPAAIGMFIRPCLISLAGSMFILHAINMLNYVNYGIYAKTEMDSYSFKAAYGALSRVKPKDVKRYVPVTKWTRRQIYQLSPAFGELADYLEGPIGQMWVEQGNGAGRIQTNWTEILGGWFIWAFRDAVADSGYYDHGKYPDEYYRRLADEINRACELGRLDCLPERATLSPVWYWYYGKYLMPSMMERILALVNFEGIIVKPIRSIGSNEQLVFFQELTNEKILGPNLNSNSVPTAAKDHWNALRVSLLKYLLKLYQLTMPIMAVYSAIAFMIALLHWVKKRENAVRIVIPISLLILILTRITLLSLINVTSWQFHTLAYLHPTHPLFLMFVFLATSESVRSFQAILHNRT